MVIGLLLESFPSCLFNVLKFNVILYKIISNVKKRFFISSLRTINKNKIHPLRVYMETETKIPFYTSTFEPFVSLRVIVCK